MDDGVADRVAVATRAARAGGKIAQTHFRTDIRIETKRDKTDIVTRADREAQREVIDVIRETFPADTIVAEEDDERKTVPGTGPAWIIDPIDGTNNYVREIPLWTTSVAATMDSEPVAAANVMPALGDEYVVGPEGTTRNGEPVSVSDRTDPETLTVCPTIYWGRNRRDEYARATSEIVHRFGDLRRFGSAQAVLSMVADGGMDGAITNVTTSPWDTMAGVYMVRRANGKVTDLVGDHWRFDSRGLVASNGRAHDDVLAAARAIDGDE